MEKGKEPSGSLSPFWLPCFHFGTLPATRTEIPKWKPRSQMGVYLGHLPLHAQTVPLVLNLHFGLISPQYHVVYGNQFTTTTSKKTNKLPANWEDLFKKHRDNVLEGEEDSIATTKLMDDWHPMPLTSPSTETPVNCHYKNIHFVDELDVPT